MSYLSRINRAVVFVDADAPDFEETALAAEEFFRTAGVPMTLRAVHKGGFILGRRRAELLVSLLPYPGWHLSWVARWSRASVKVGRFQLKHGKVFDIVVTDPPGTVSQQNAVFRQVVHILKRIQ